MREAFIRINIISALLLSFTVGCAQDIHFSQVSNTPLLISPALAGEFSGNSRFMFNYRNQWSSITSNPYTTYAFACDRSFLKEIISVGALAFSDKAGDAGMGITQVNLMIATKVEINETQYLKLGINGAWSQQSFNPNGLTWNSQFNGTIIDPNLNSGEIFSHDKFSYVDFSTGILWERILKNKAELQAGLSAYHVISPVFTNFSEVERLPVRWCAHANLAYPLKDKAVVLYPSLLAMIQGSSYEIMAGGAARFIFNLNSKYTGYYKASYLYAGAYYRYRDAIIAYARIDYKSQFNIGISYDINVSALSTVSNAGGGIEISLSYVIPEPSQFKLK